MPPSTEKILFTGRLEAENDGLKARRRRGSGLGGGMWCIIAVEDAESGQDPAGV